MKSRRLRRWSCFAVVLWLSTVAACVEASADAPEAATLEGPQQRLRLAVNSMMNPRCNRVCTEGFAERLQGELRRRLGIEMLHHQDDAGSEDLLLDIYLFREFWPKPGLAMVYRFSPALPKGSVYSVHLRDFLVREKLTGALTSRSTIDTAARNIVEHFPYLVRVTTKDPDASIWNVVWSTASVVRQGDCMVRANADPTFSEISVNNHDTESCAVKLNRKQMVLEPTEGLLPKSDTLWMKSKIYKTPQPVEVSVKIQPLAKDTAIHPAKPIPRGKIEVFDKKTRIFYGDKNGWIRFTRLPLERIVELNVKDTDPKRRFEGKLRWKTALPFKSTVEIPVETRAPQVRYVLRFYPPPLPEQIGAPGGRVLGVSYVAEDAAPNIYHSEGGKPYLNPPQKDPSVRVSAAHLLKKFYDAMDPLPDGSDAYFRIEAFDLPLNWNVPGTSRRTLPHTFKIQVRSFKEVAFLDVAVARDLIDRMKDIRSLSLENLEKLEFSNGEASEILRDARQLVGPRGALRWHPQLVQVAHAMGQRALDLGQPIPEPRDAREFYDVMLEALSVPVLGQTDEYGPIPKPIPDIEPADGPYVIYYPKYGEVYSKIFAQTLSRNDPSDVRRKRVQRFYAHIDPLLDIENSQNAPYHLMAVEVMTQVLDVALWNRIDDVNEQTTSERDKREKEDIKQLAARIERGLASARSFAEGSETLKIQHADSRRKFRELLQDIVTKAQRASGEVVSMAGEWGPKTDESRYAIEELDEPIQFNASPDGPVADVLGKLMKVSTSRKRLRTLLYQARHEELAAIVSTYPAIEVPQVFAKKRSQFEKIKQALMAAEDAAERFFQHEKALGHLRDGYREWEDFERDLHTRIQEALDPSDSCARAIKQQLESMVPIARALDPEGLGRRWEDVVQKWRDSIADVNKTLPKRAQYMRGDLSDGRSQAVKFGTFISQAKRLLRCQERVAADVAALTKDLIGKVQSRINEVRELLDKLENWNKRASRHEKVKIPRLPLPKPDRRPLQAAQTVDASWKRVHALWDKARQHTKEVCEQLGQHFDLVDKCAQQYADQFQSPKRLADIKSQLERGEILAAWGRCKRQEQPALSNLGLCFDRLKSNVATLTTDSKQWHAELKQAEEDWKEKRAQKAIEALLKLVVEETQ